MTIRKMEIEDPHEDFFEEIFSYSEIMIDLLKSSLPLKTIDRINFHNFMLSYESFNNIGGYIDVIYETRIDGKDGYIYLILEYNKKGSNPSMPMPLIFLKRNNILMEEYTKENETNELPVIINICMQAGKLSCQGPTKLQELIKEDKVIYEDYNLINLQSLSIEDLRKFKKAGTPMLLLKQGTSQKDIGEWLVKNPKKLDTFMRENSYTDDISEDMFDYISSLPSKYKLKLQKL